MKALFDKKYKIVLNIGWAGQEDYIEKITWIHENIQANVDMKYGMGGILYVAFENPDDALVFKIKYSV